MTDSHGDTAILHGDLTVDASHVNLPVNHAYVVNQTTMVESTDTGAAKVEPAKGLIVWCLQVIAIIGDLGQNVSLVPMMALDTRLDQKSANSATDTASSTARQLTLIRI